MVGLVIDIETTSRYPTISEQTGYLRDDCEILEVGYLRVDTITKEILSHGVLYFYKPYFRVESEAQQIHGLTRSFLEQYEKDFEKNLITLTALIQKTLLIGKNTEGFDIKFIDRFIDKHSKGILKLENTVNKQRIKTYDGRNFFYDNASWSQDMQVIFPITFRQLYYDKYKEVLPKNRKGKLGEYIDVLNAREEVDRIYASLTKDRETGAHGALYDVVMTYVVWLECDKRNLLD